MLDESGSLTSRPLSPDDARVSADLLNAMEFVDRIGENYEEADTRQELVDPYLDRERASLGVFDGNVMVGFMKATWKPGAERVHRVVMDGGVHPAYRRRGIGTALVQAGITAATRLHALHHPGLDLVVDVQTAEHITGATALFRSQGFTPVFYYQHLEHGLGTLPDVTVPEGLSIESWTEGTDEEFRLLRNETFADHHGLAPMPPDNWRNRMTDHTFRPELSFLLRDMTDRSPAGMLLTKYWEADTTFTGVRDAHVLLVGTRRRYRGRGVAGALVAQALTAAARHGYDRASVRVDSSHPTDGYGIYTRAGFTPTLRFMRWSHDIVTPPA